MARAFNWETVASHLPYLVCALILSKDSRVILGSRVGLSTESKENGPLLLSVVDMVCPLFSLQLPLYFSGSIFHPSLFSLLTSLTQFPLRIHLDLHSYSFLDFLVSIFSPGAESFLQFIPLSNVTLSHRKSGRIRGERSRRGSNKEPG